jgi:hypothetical protein
MHLLVMFLVERTVEPAYNDVGLYNAVATINCVDRWS